MNIIASIIISLTLLSLMVSSTYADTTGDNITLISQHKFNKYINNIAVLNNTILISDEDGISLCDINGNIKWSHKIGRNIGWILNDSVIVISRTPPSYMDILVQIYDLNGNLKKKSTLSFGESSRGIGNNYYLYKEKQLIFSTGNYLYSFDLDGNLEWKRNPSNAGSDISSIGDKIIVDLCVFSSDGISRWCYPKRTKSIATSSNYIFGATRDDKIIALDANTKSPLQWHLELDEPITYVDMQNNLIVAVPHNSTNLYLFDKNGGLKWKKEFKDTVVWAKIIDNGVVVATYGGDIYHISNNGSFLGEFNIGNMIGTNTIDSVNNMIIVGLPYQKNNTILIINTTNKNTNRYETNESFIPPLPSKSKKYILAPTNDTVYVLNLNGTLHWNKKFNKNIGAIEMNDKYIAIMTVSNFTIINNRVVDILFNKLYVFDINGSIVFEKNITEQSPGIISTDISDHYFILNNRKSIKTFDVVNGNKKWKFDNKDFFYTISSLINHNEKEIVTITYKNIYFHTLDGLPKLSYRLDGMITSEFALSLSGNYLALSTYDIEPFDNATRPKGHLYLLNTDNISFPVKWEEYLNCSGGVGCGDILMSASDNYLAIASEYTGEIYLFDTNGVLKWTHKIAEYPIRPNHILIYKNQVIVGTGDNCYDNGYTVCKGNLYIFDINGNLKLNQSVGEVTAINSLDNRIIVSSYRGKGEGYLLVFSLFGGLPIDIESDYNHQMAWVIILLTIILSLIAIWHRKFK